MFKGQSKDGTFAAWNPNASSKTPRFLSIHASENDILETTEPWGEKIQSKPSQRNMLGLATEQAQLRAIRVAVHSPETALG